MRMRIVLWGLGLLLGAGLIGFVAPNVVVSGVLGFIWGLSWAAYGVKYVFKF